MTTEGKNNSDAKFYVSLYKAFSKTFEAWQRSMGGWREIYENDLDRLLDYLPHGSGIDVETLLDVKASKVNRLVFNSAYHVMNRDGFYTRWIEYSVILTPSLSFDFDVRVTGNFGREQDIKQYLTELYEEAFCIQVKELRV